MLVHLQNIAAVAVLVVLTALTLAAVSFAADRFIVWCWRQLRRPRVRPAAPGLKSDRRRLDAAVSLSSRRIS